MQFVKLNYIKGNQVWKRQQTPEIIKYIEEDAEMNEVIRVQITPKDWNEGII